jgi:hypothetical protein
MCKTIQEKLNEWADRTVCTYKRIIDESNIDAAFYTQTPLDRITESPELIVMGINPGSTGSYHRQIEEGTVIDGKYLLKGNPCWEEHKKWRYWNKCIDTLNKAFPNCDKDNQCIFTNATFMGTLKANEISGRMFDAFLCTMELIDILEPKYVICLSGRECFKRIENSGKQFEYIRLSDRVLVGRIDKIDKIVYIGIPHPSAHLSREERSYIQNVILFIKKNSNHSLKEIEFLVGNEPNLRPGAIVRRNCSYEEATSVMIKVKAWAKDNLPHVATEENRDWVKFHLNENLVFQVVAQKRKQYVQLFIKELSSLPNGLLDENRFRDPFKKGAIFISDVKLTHLGDSEEAITNKVIELIKELI